ncbi:MAG: DNA-3-methyladenine glycosylase [Kiritimatiellae bacterium]|nr:DNA-3-methyladenine glycosylase [Kiritimatiellia bacterium]
MGGDSRRPYAGGGQCSTSTVLAASFFARDTVTVARELLGRTLCRRLAPRRVVRLRIVETEAYDGFDDRASHAHAGETARTAVMYGPPGYWCVYLCYGMHWLLNIVTRERGYPAAVLIRGCEGVHGPGRLTRALQIDRNLNRTRASPAGGLWIEAGTPPRANEIDIGPRIGVAYAGPYWASRPWRFRTGHDSE